MNFKNLNIDISYQKQIDIAVEFPLEIIGKYNGLDNLDETLDDNILPIIDQAIVENGGYIKNAKLDILQDTNIKKEKISYQLSLILNPPTFNLICIVDNLTREKLQNGLQINRMLQNGKTDTLYSDIYYLDK